MCPSSSFMVSNLCQIICFNGSIQVYYLVHLLFMFISVQCSIFKFMASIVQFLNSSIFRNGFSFYGFSGQILIQDPNV